MSPLHKILIVDDDPEIALLLKRMLQNQGSANITICNSIREADEKLKGSDPDIAFIDINLGDGIGYELVPVLLRNKDVRIVIMSATGLPDEEQIVRNRGAHFFLPKPFTQNDVKNALHTQQTYQN